MTVTGGQTESTARVGVIGGGLWGRNVIRTLNRLGALAGIVEGDEPRRRVYASEYPAIPLYGEWRQLLDTDCDAVAVVTPTATHYEIVMAALAAGKDVFVEKPMATDSRCARRMALAASEANRLLMVGHLLLFQPAIEQMAHIVAAGAIGYLYSIRHERLNLGRARRGESVVWDIGVHDIAVMLELAGQPPERVRATGHRMLALDVEDEIHAHLEFASGVRGNLHSAWLWPETQRRTLLRGSKGMLVYDEIKGTLTRYQRWIDADLSVHDHGCESLPVAECEPLTLELQHFLDRLADRRTPRSNGDAAVPVIETLERIDQAIADSSGR